MCVMSDVDTNIEASTESREGRKEYIPNRMGLPGSCDGLTPRQLFHLQPCRQKVSSMKSGFPSGVHRVVDTRREHRRERRWKVGRSSRGDKHDRSPSGQPLVFKVFLCSQGVIGWRPDLGRERHLQERAVMGPAVCAGEATEPGTAALLSLHRSQPRFVRRLGPRSGGDA